MHEPDVVERVKHIDKVRIVSHAGWGSGTCTALTLCSHQRKFALDVMTSKRLKQFRQGSNADKVFPAGAKAKNISYLRTLDEFLDIARNAKVPVYRSLPPWALITRHNADFVVVAPSISFKGYAGVLGCCGDRRRRHWLLPLALCSLAKRINRCLNMEQSKGATLKCGVVYKRAKGLHAGAVTQCERCGNTHVATHVQVMSGRCDGAAWPQTRPWMVRVWLLCVSGSERVVTCWYCGAGFQSPRMGCPDALVV